MTANAVMQLLLYLAAVLALVKPLGAYMARVYEGQLMGLDKWRGPVERLIYGLCGVSRDERQRDMGWKRYALAMLLFNFAGL